MKFVVADGAKDMNKILFNDLVGNSKYVLVDKYNLYKNKLINKLCLINISTSLNLKFRMPLKMFFYKRIFGAFNPNDELCFFFGTSWYDPDLFEYLKKKYPRAKLILNFHDTVQSKLDRFKNMNLPYIKKTFDLVYTYSEIDQQEYDFEYTPDMYSKLNQSDMIRFPEYDVVFIGAAKDRIQKIHEIYTKLKQYGLSCWFCIVRAREEDKLHGSDIIYTDKNVPFLEVISRQYYAKCILEITQENCEDATLRFWDAVMYNKRIITNCSAVKKYSYYDENYVSVIESAEDIDIRFLQSKSPVEFNYKGDVSPIAIFDIIEKKLSGSI